MKRSLLKVTYIKLEEFPNERNAAKIVKAAESHPEKRLFPSVTNIEIKGVGRCSMSQLLHDNTITKGNKTEHITNFSKIPNPKYL